MVHVIAVPERLKNAVAKAQHEQVLDRVFSQIMVDTINLPLIKHVEDNLIERLGGSQVASKRFLNDDAHPGIGRRGMRQPGAAQLFHDGRINLRRRRKVKQAVAAETLGGLQLGQPLGQLGKGFRIAVIARAVIEVRSKGIPLLGFNRSHVGNRFGGFAQTGAEQILLHSRAGEPDDGVARAKSIVGGQIVHRGNDLALGEVARGAKQNHRAGFGYPAVHRPGTICLPGHPCLLRGCVPFGQIARRSKLYLNPIFSKLQPQLFRALVEDRVHAEFSRPFQIQGAVVNEKALLGRALRDFQRHAKNGFFGLARMHIARAEKNQEVSSKIESLDAVLIELQWLIVDGADKVFLRLRHLVQNRSRIRIFLGLRKHEGGEFFARERAGAIEERAVEIFIEGDLAAIEGRKREVVPVLEFFPVQVKRGGSLFPRSAVPAVGQDDAADVPKQGGYFGQADYLRFFLDAAK